MKDDLEIVLTIHKGENFTPRRGMHVVVEATLRGNAVTTDPTPLTVQPKFHWEANWIISENVFRNCKLKRIPIKVECSVYDNHNNQQSLGHVLVPLTSAALGSDKAPMKSYNLVGGPSLPSKTLPKLLLSLCVVKKSDNPRIKEEVMDQDDMVEDDGISTDSEDEEDSEPIFPSQARTKHNWRSRAPSVQYDKDVEVSEYMVSSEEEEEVREVGRNHRIRNRDSDRKVELPLSKKRRSERLQSRDQTTATVRILDVLDEDERATNIGQSVTAAAARLGETLRLRKQRESAQGYKGQKENNVVAAICLSDDENQPSNNDWGKKPSAKQIEVKAKVQENGHSTTSSSDQFAMALPGTSSGVVSKGKSAVTATTLSPKLNDSGGFFQIGPAGEPDEQMFHFSVTIVYAKYVDQVIPKHLEVEDGTLRFCYSLLGYMVQSEPILDPSNPDFQADRAEGKVCSTLHNVMAYFKEHPTLPIHLVHGSNSCLASCCINLSSFGVEIFQMPDKPLTIEGTYPLTPMMVDPLMWKPTNEPVLGVTIQLSMSPKPELPAVAQFPPVHAQENAVLMVDYVSSSSDESSYRGSRMGREIARYKRQRKNLLNEAAMEVETWKDRQQEMFLESWEPREAAFQEILASAWEERVGEIEKELQRKLQSCTTLHSRYSDAVHRITVQETNMAAKQEKLIRREEKLKEKEAQFMQKERKRKLKKYSSGDRDSEEVEMLKEELANERRLRREGERQVRILESANATTSRSAEMSYLNNQLKVEEVENLRREKEHLMEKLNSVTSRKEYYKMKWVEAVQQIHQLQTGSFHPPQNIRMDINQPSSPAFYGGSPQNKGRLKFRE